MAMLIEAALAGAIGVASVEAAAAENRPKVELRRGSVAARPREDESRDAVVNAVRADAAPVSYTHLTLPTKRIV